MAIVTWSTSPEYDAFVQTLPNPTPGAGYWTTNTPTVTFSNGNKTVANDSLTLTERVDVGSNITQTGLIYFELDYTLDFDNIGFLYGSMAEVGSTLPYQDPVPNGGIVTIGENYNTGVQYVWFRQWTYPPQTFVETSSILFPTTLQQNDRLGFLVDTALGRIIYVTVNGVQVLPAMLSGGDLTLWNTHNQWTPGLGIRAHAQMRAYTQGQTTTVYGNYADQLYPPDGDGVMIDLGGDLIPVPFEVPPPYPQTLFPLQFKRQQAYPVDVDTVFYSTADRLAYLTSPRRHMGMVVVDAEENRAYLLNNARNAWIPIGSSTLTVQEEGVAVGAQSTTTLNFIGAAVTASTTDDGVTVDVDVTGSGGGPDNVFIFQVGTPGPLPGTHLHYATMLTSVAQSLISGTDPAVAVADPSQPSVVLTSSSTNSHTHDITVFFDHEMHAFVVTDITSNHGHVGSVVGDGPVRYNSVLDAVEYRSSVQARWIDIATPKVSTKTADYTIGLTDNQYIFRMDSSSAISLIIPNDTTADIPIGTTCVLSQNGTGAASFVPESGVTIHTPSTLTIAMQYGKASITKTGANRWEVEGNVGGNIEINASGAPMGGFKAYTATPFTVTAGTTTVNLSAAFTSANGFWYGLMDPDNPIFDWNHVKVIGGQVTLNSIGSFYVTVKAHVMIDLGVVNVQSTYVDLMLTDGNDNIIGIASMPVHIEGAGVITRGMTLSTWMNNDGVSGPFGGNQTVKVKIINPYSSSITAGNIDVCFWYADTRQPRAFSGT